MYCTKSLIMLNNSAMYSVGHKKVPSTLSAVYSRNIENLYLPQMVERTKSNL